MDIKIKYPSHLQEIPLSAYQDWLKVQENTNDEELLAFKFVSIFTGLDLRTISRMSVKDVHFLIGKIKEVLTQEPKFHRRWKFGGKEFGLVPELEKLTWGEYIDIDSNLQDWGNMHKAMAVLYRPIEKKLDDTYELVEYKADEVYHDIMLHCPMNIVMSTLVFFWTLEKTLLNNLVTFLKNETKKSPEEINLVNGRNSTSNGTGTTAYIELAMEIYTNLTEQPNYHYVKPLRSFPTLPKKKRSKQTNAVDV